METVAPFVMFFVLAGVPSLILVLAGKRRPETPKPTPRQHVTREEELERIVADLGLPSLEN